MAHLNNIDIESLKDFVKEFTKKILGDEDRSNMCFTICYPLSLYFKSKKIPITLRGTSYDGNTHFWLKFGKKNLSENIIDPTINQFFINKNDVVDYSKYFDNDYKIEDLIVRFKDKFLNVEEEIKKYQNLPSPEIFQAHINDLKKFQLRRKLFLTVNLRILKFFEEEIQNGNTQLEKNTKDFFNLIYQFIIKFIDNTDYNQIFNEFNSFKSKAIEYKKQKESKT